MKSTNIIVKTFFGLVLMSCASSNAFALICSSPFSVSDVTFRGQNADNCSGLSSGNNDAGNQGTGASGLNAAFGSTWTLLAKDNDPSTTGWDTGTLSGLDATFTLNQSTSVSSNSSGVWTLSWTGSDLPIKMDFAAVLKGGNVGWVGYLFEDELFETSPSSGSGTWEIKFNNGGGNIPDISHFSLWVANVEMGDTIDDPNAVPEPGTTALFGLGLLGLLAARRRQLI